MLVISEALAIRVMKPELCNQSILVQLLSFCDRSIIHLSTLYKPFTLRACIPTSFHTSNCFKSTFPSFPSPQLALKLLHDAVDMTSIILFVVKLTNFVVRLLIYCELELRLNCFLLKTIYVTAQDEVWNRNFFLFEPFLML